MKVETPSVTGTGFIFDKRGWVLTNAHVVGQYLKVNVVAESEGPVDSIGVTGEVIQVDDEADLAFVLISGRDTYPELELGDAKDIRLGQDVIAIGFPLAKLLGEEISVTRGIVSSLRHIGSYNYIQTDAAVNPGSSGGPLLDMNGKVIGVTSRVLRSALGEVIEGVGLALSVKEVRELVPILTLPTSVPASTRLWNSYEGEVHNTTLDLSARMTLTLYQSGAALTGDVELFDPLDGDGPIRGKLKGKRVEFTLEFASTGFGYAIEFTGIVLSDGQLAGTYSAAPTGEQGTWEVSPAK